MLLIDHFRKLRLSHYQATEKSIPDKDLRTVFSAGHAAKEKLDLLSAVRTPLQTVGWYLVHKGLEKEEVAAKRLDRNIAKAQIRVKRLDSRLQNGRYRTLENAEYQALFAQWDVADLSWQKIDGEIPRNPTFVVFNHFELSINVPKVNLPRNKPKQWT